MAPSRSEQASAADPTHGGHRAHDGAPFRRLQWSLVLAAGATAVLAGAARLIADGALRAPVDLGRIGVTMLTLTVGVALAALAVSAAWPTPRLRPRRTPHVTERQPRQFVQNQSRQFTRHQPDPSPAPHSQPATRRAAASRASDSGLW